MPMPAPEVAPSVEADFMHEIATTSRNEHEVPNASERTAAAEAQVPPTRVIPMRRQHDTCTLTDVATGRTYQVIVRRTPIGRERVPGGIVLHDPNVSRRHAELVFENGLWQIRDLNSTNGTLVDDMDVREAILTDGDVITIGLTNLEFKAG
ncbi:MAG: FHA domain-containing protein [Atopobiaceae bacterium]|nr:FHA domain-containing protein [Atopobiaceae bacterium]